jgi:hypothetical protein
MAEVLKATRGPDGAREAEARLAGEPEAFQARPWWRRLAGWGIERRQPRH